MLVSTNAPNEPSTCRRPTGQQLTTPDTVKARLTPKRPRRQVENDDSAAFTRRILRAYSRRVGDSDIDALVLMLDLAEVIDTGICLIAAELDDAPADRGPVRAC